MQPLARRARIVALWLALPALVALATLVATDVPQAQAAQDLRLAFRTLPAAVSADPHQLIAALRGESEGQIVSASISANGLGQVGPLWGNWQQFASGATSAPTVTSWREGTLHVFVRGPANQLWHRWYENGQWYGQGATGWEDLGGRLDSAPSCESWGFNRVSCFAVLAGSSSLQHKYYDGTGWSNWQNLGGVVTSAPSAVSWGQNRLDVFVRGSDNAMYQTWWNGRDWSAWVRHGGELASGPGCVSRGFNGIDCFVRGTTNKLYQLIWNGSTWGPWLDKGGAITSSPSAVVWGSNRISVFARGQNNTMEHLWWDGANWNGWQDLGERLEDAPGCASWGNNRIDCFALTTTSGNPAMGTPTDRTLDQRTWGFGN